MSNVEMITNFYNDILRRAPDEEGFNYWVNAANNGIPLDTIKDIFLNSHEASSSVFPLVSIYQAIFDRQPDTDGVGYWAKWVREGALKISDVIEAFMGTNEFKEKYGHFDPHGPANETFVKQLYLNTLGYEADPEGLAYWTSGIVNAVQLVEHFITLPDFVNSAYPAITALLTDWNVDFYEDRDLFGNLYTPENPGGENPGNGGGNPGGGGTPPVNNPPVVNNAVGDQDIVGGNTITLDVSNVFTDPENQPLSLTLVNAPAWAVLNGTTLTIHPAYAVDGTFSISLQASDGSKTTVDSFDVNVTSFGNYVHGQWQALDAQYVAIAQAGGNGALFGNYADPVHGEAAYSVNIGFLTLGAEYINYLNNGGVALTDIIVKQGPTRSQSLHDNILGNVGDAAIADRHLTNDLSVQGLDFANFGSRPWNSGNFNDPAILTTAAWDFENGVNRSDYNGFDVEAFSATLNSRAINPNGPEMWMGDGNSADNFHVTTDNASGVEIGLKAKLYKLGELDQTDINGNVYTVPSGDSAEANPGARAAWSIDFSATTGLNGSGLTKNELDFKLYIDVDSSDLIDYRLIGNIEDAADAATPDAGVFQNSFNIAWIKNMIDNGAYDFGEGTFNVKIDAVYNGNVIETNEIIVNVVGQGAELVV